MMRRVTMVLVLPVFMVACSDNPPAPKASKKQMPQVANEEHEERIAAIRLKIGDKITRKEIEKRLGKPWEIKTIAGKEKGAGILSTYYVYPLRMGYCPVAENAQIHLAPGATATFGFEGEEDDGLLQDVTLKDSQGYKYSVWTEKISDLD